MAVVSGMPRNRACWAGLLRSFVVEGDPRAFLWQRRSEIQSNGKFNGEGEAVQG